MELWRVGFFAYVLACMAPFLGGLLVLASIAIPYGPWIVFGLFFLGFGLLARRVKAGSRGEKPETGFRSSQITVEEVFPKRVED